MIQPIKWHGGKGRLAKYILAEIPDHAKYLEPYAGGLSVLLRKPFDNVAEWVNDTNGELTNFWRCLRGRASFEFFQREVEAIPMSEAEFRKAERLGKLDSPVSTVDPVSRAVAFFVRMRQSRQGLGKDYATPTSRTRRGMNEQVSAWHSAVDGLPEIHERLRRVEVWNRPAVEAIRKLDSPDLLVYADPPYAHETRNTVGEYGEHEMSADDHIELLDTLGGMSGRFILSGYRSTTYDAKAHASSWRRVDVDTPNNASSSKSKERKTESLWMNF